MARRREFTLCATAKPLEAAFSKVATHDGMRPVLRLVVEGLVPSRVVSLVVNALSGPGQGYGVY